MGTCVEQFLSATKTRILVLGGMTANTCILHGSAIDALNTFGVWHTPAFNCMI
jgi:hypothetical protein